MVDLETDGTINGRGIDFLPAAHARPQKLKNLTGLQDIRLRTADHDLVAAAADFHVKRMLDLVQVVVLFAVQNGNQTIILECEAFLRELLGYGRFPYKKVLYMNILPQKIYKTYMGF